MKIPKIKSFFLFNHLQFLNKDCRLVFISEYYNDDNYFLDIKIKKEKVVEIKDDDEKDFIIKSTGNIDVYELYNINTNEFDSIACVNSLSVSLELRKRFNKEKEFKITQCN